MTIPILSVLATWTEAAGLIVPSRAVSELSMGNSMTCYRKGRLP